jgi:uncharacterized protein YndB with AHSA1/START domain
VTRVFEAPVAAVWKAWSDGALVARWWGPKGFTCPMARMDFREGGTSLVCMRAAKAFGGRDLFNTWTYEKIEPMKRFAYVLRFSDKSGKACAPADQGLPAELPREVRNEVVFRDAGGGRTEVTVTEQGWKAGPLMQMSKMGLEQCLDKMAALFGK